MLALPSEPEQRRSPSLATAKPKVYTRGRRCPREDLASPAAEDNKKQRTLSDYDAAASSPPVRSIYSLASPWAPAAVVPGERSGRASRNEGGGHALRFGDEDDDDEEEGEQRERSGSLSCSHLPVDIPGGHTTGGRWSFAIDATPDNFREEGWASLWNRYTRICPGTFMGCSPPGPQLPPDSPLHSASSTERASVSNPSSARESSLVIGTDVSRDGGDGAAGGGGGDGGDGPASVASIAAATVSRWNVATPPPAPTSGDGGSSGGSYLPSWHRHRRHHRHHHRRRHHQRQQQHGGEGDARWVGALTGAGEVECPEARHVDGGSGGSLDIFVLVPTRDEHASPLTGACAWEQLSRLPLEEAGERLGTFLAKGFSAGVAGGGAEGGEAREIHGGGDDDDDHDHDGYGYGRDDNEDEEWDPQDSGSVAGSDFDSSDDELMFELEI